MRRITAGLIACLAGLVLVWLCQLLGLLTRLELVTRDARILSGALKNAGLAP